MPKAWVSGCFFNSSSLCCNSLIGRSKSSWCFICFSIGLRGFASNLESKEPDLHPALSGDEVYTPSPRRSEGWHGQLFARCSNRTTSKTSILTLNEQRNLFAYLIRYLKRAPCSKFYFQRNFFVNPPLTAPTYPAYNMQ